MDERWLQHRPLPENHSPFMCSRTHLWMMDDGHYLRGLLVPLQIESKFFTWNLTKCDQLSRIDVDPVQSHSNVFNISLKREACSFGLLSSGSHLTVPLMFPGSTRWYVWPLIFMQLGTAIGVAVALQRSCHHYHRNYCPHLAATLHYYYYKEDVNVVI